jgi:hypothetical protein
VGSPRKEQVLPYAQALQAIAFAILHKILPFVTRIVACAWLIRIFRLDANFALRFFLRF